VAGLPGDQSPSGPSESEHGEGVVSRIYLSQLIPPRVAAAIATVTLAAAFGLEWRVLIH
jgi:hypothetical protein